MDVEKLAREVLRRRVGRSGRRFKGTDAITREVDAAGKPPEQHRAFNYATGSYAKAAEQLLELLNYVPDSSRR